LILLGGFSGSSFDKEIADFEILRDAAMANIFDLYIWVHSGAT